MPHAGDAAYDFDLALDAELCPAPGGTTGRLFMNDIQNVSSRYERRHRPPRLPCPADILQVRLRLNHRPAYLCSPTSDLPLLLLSRVPYMFLHGNHDKPFGFAYPTEFFRNMPANKGRPVQTGNKANPVAPNNWWFSFEVPGLATFVALSTEIYQCCSGSYHHLVPEQFAWLNATLSNVDRAKTPWLIVAGSALTAA